MSLLVLNALKNSRTCIFVLKLGFSMHLHLFKNCIQNMRAHIGYIYYVHICTCITEEF